MPWISQINVYGVMRPATLLPTGEQSGIRGISSSHVNIYPRKKTSRYSRSTLAHVTLAMAMNTDPLSLHFSKRATPATPSKQPQGEDTLENLNVAEQRD